MRHRIRIRLFTYFIGLVGINLTYGQEPFVCTGDFYLSQSMGIVDGFSNLFRVEVDSITQEIIFTPLEATNEHIFNAMGYRVTDNFIYGLDPVELNLLRIDASGKTSVLRHLDELDVRVGYYGADIFPTGDFMVMIGALNNTDVHLVVINLTNPAYPTEIIPLTQGSTGGIPGTRIVDIAFDPLTRNLYGVDIINYRLVKINLSSGVIQDNLYPISDVHANIAALFFDAFGNLFGYGATGSGGSNFGMFRINKVSGQLTFATFGPSTGGVDGCSCPFNISMQKTVSPEATTPCSDVFYVFHIANGSQSRQVDIGLEDFLPNGFVIEEIVYNPYSSRIVEGIGSNHLLIDQLEIPSGQDSIVIRVNVGNNAPGTYGNLAHLNNLPENLGISRLSDNPQTLRNDAHDSTYVTIEPPVFSFEEVDGICAGDSIILKASLAGASYLWQDGSMDSFLLVVSPGMYSVTATTACDTYTATTTIREHSISIEFLPQKIEVALGDMIVLEPVINNSGMELIYDWQAPQENLLSCLDCENPSVRPLINSQYELNVTNEYGCSALSTLSIQVIINRDIYMANIFSPNNDGVNDFFFVQSPGSFNIKYFQIFDRWGNKVYESNDSLSNIPSEGWDGTSKGKIMDKGVYLWTAVIEFLDGLETQHSGSVTLIR